MEILKWDYIDNKKTEIIGLLNLLEMEDGSSNLLPMLIIFFLLIKMNKQDKEVSELKLIHIKKIEMPGLLMVSQDDLLLESYINYNYFSKI